MQSSIPSKIRHNAASGAKYNMRPRLHIGETWYNLIVRGEGVRKVIVARFHKENILVLHR